MSMSEKLQHIGAEMKGHAPFTLAGAILGVGFMLLFRNMSKPAAGVLFGILHPAHVVLSAIVTAGLYKLHARKAGFWMVLVIGYLGGVVVATVSDSIIPYMGERVLGVAVPLHADTHAHCASDHTSDACPHTHGPQLHLGFIKHWYSVTPAAVLGVLIAWFFPHTRFPHAAHVLVSVWASSAHMLMNTQVPFGFVIAIGYVIVLFVAVLLPCCISDIVFPLLFVKPDIELKNACVCADHALHSHPHTHKHNDSCGVVDAERV